MCPQLVFAKFALVGKKKISLWKSKYRSPISRTVPKDLNLIEGTEVIRAPGAHMSVRVDAISSSSRQSVIFSLLISSVRVS
jgi:hypothetical protein